MGLTAVELAQLSQLRLSNLQANTLYSKLVQSSGNTEEAIRRYQEAARRLLQELAPNLSDN